MRPQFRIEQRGAIWVVDVFYVTDGSQPHLFSDWGYEEPFSEEVYQTMQKWCADTFKTWLRPRRARRMSYAQFHFQRKKDVDWFVLYWSGIDISVE